VKEKQSENYFAFVSIVELSIAIALRGCQDRNKWRADVKAVMALFLSNLA
jgi:hypothetical protein